jgi:hypothetical protein
VQGPWDEMIRPKDDFEALEAKIKPGAVLVLRDLCGLGKVADMTGAKD